MQYVHENIKIIQILIWKLEIEISCPSAHEMNTEILRSQNLELEILEIFLLKYY